MIFLRELPWKHFYCMILLYDFSKLSWDRIDMLVNNSFGEETDSFTSLFFAGALFCSWTWQESWQYLHQKLHFCNMKKLPWDNRIDSDSFPKIYSFLFFQKKGLIKTLHVNFVSTVKHSSTLFIIEISLFKAEA